MFKEYTAIALPDYIDYCEIMIHFNEKGKLIHAYCYKDDKPHFNQKDKMGNCIYDKYGDYKYITLRTKPSINSLFLHLSTAQIINNLRSILIINDVDDNGEAVDDPILSKAINNYKHLQTLD